MGQRCNLRRSRRFGAKQSPRLSTHGRQFLQLELFSRPTRYPEVRAHAKLWVVALTERRIPRLPSPSEISSLSG